MSPERWQRIEELFDTVAEYPRSEREAYLTRLCGGDEALRREVLELLAHDTVDDFLAEQIGDAAVSFTAEPSDELAADAMDEMIGVRIGPYRLTQLIGRGGMGAVYAAVRDDAEFAQKVAIKLIRRGMDSDFVRERFLRERRILAALDHPHIARLFDGGTTPDGQPYFVMEFVDGVPISDYCRQQQLSLKQTLLLFRDVCAAVQHAHQKLAVHRDLKPSNILVTASVDGKGGTPKLLDFGIAKLLSPDPGEADTRTETSVRLMTPDYAAPEQVRGDAITTATDVYSLGVVLYELLTGRRPYQFETYAPLEIERVICYEEPRLPSACKTARQRDRETASTNTVSPSSRLSAFPSQLRGDLDNIVLMALRKEPARRYQSVEQFSEDIRRHLDGLPVVARKDTFSYRAGKFARRHKAGVALLALLALFAVGMTWQATRVTRERDRAQRRFAQVRALANTFLFDFHDKIQHLSGSTEARELVVKTALEYLNSLAQEAAGDAQLEGELAAAYLRVGDVQGNPWDFNLGQTQAAMQSYEKGLALARQLNRAGNHDLKLLRVLAQGYFKLGALQAQMTGQTAAHETLRQALLVAEQMEQQTRSLDDLRLLQDCHTRLGDTWLDTGDPASALASYRETVRLAERRVSEFPNDAAQLNLAMDYTRLAEPLVSLGDVTGALAQHRQSLAVLDPLMPNHAEEPRYLRARMITLIWLGNLSGNPRFINISQTGWGDARAALPYYREALALAEQMAALDAKNASARRDVLGGHRLLAEILTLDQPVQAGAHCRQALGLVRELLATAPKDAQLLRREAQLLNVQAATLRKLGNRPGALQNLRQTVLTWRAWLARDTANLTTRAELHATLLALADTTLETGDHSGALPLYREALTLAETPPIAQSADLYVRWRLADAYAGLNRYHTARAAAAPMAERLEHWRAARQYAQQSLSLWEGWRPSTSFDTRRREQAARAVTACDAALAKLNAAPNPQP